MLKSNVTKKLVEEFEKSLKEIIKLLEDNNLNKAIDNIENTFSSLFRLNSMFFDSMSDENLIEILKVGSELEKDKAIIISKLLEEKAKILEKNNKTSESFYTYLKSLNLFVEAYLCDNEAELTYCLNDINFIIDKLSQYNLPKETLIRLINYYIAYEDFALAENMLYELLETTNYSKDSLNIATCFYENLLYKDDEILKKGNLPREEVLDGLNTIKKKSM
ncbi:DUF6483 family protein [Clostridium rectalis]|uniref:DUF6483 family protein n=1 Tax=Clostridium rectalis TaxID=2040295 RepID=UPI000F638132|nr:DUF6483 family protein [Clostridium rectalis]